MGEARGTEIDKKLDNPRETRMTMVVQYAAAAHAASERRRFLLQLNDKLIINI
jgi:hypothetical protein